MKFIVPSQLLLKNLQAVGGIISSNSAMPIVENVLFEINNNSLKITSTDLETTMVAEVELSECDGSFDIVIPYKIVLETLKTLADIPVVFNIGEDLSIEIATGDVDNFKFTGIEAVEFPQKPALTNSTSFEFDAKMFANCISKTIFATGMPDVRPVMAGVFLDIHPETISFVATDAHRLVRYRKHINTGITAGIILPKKPLNSLKTILATLDGNVRIDFDDTRVAFTIDTLTVISKLIEGTYPKYEAVIPGNNNNTLKVDRLPLLQKIRTTSIYANQSTHQLRISLEANKMKLIAEDLDTASKATAGLACEFENVDGGENFEIGFSSKFLNEILNNIDSDEVVFKLSQPTNAGLVYPLSNGELDEDLLILLMPVMLNA